MNDPAARVVARAVEKARASPDTRVTIVPAPYCSTPATLLRGLAQYETHETVTDRVGVGMLLGGAELAEAVRQGRLDLFTWHPHGLTRSLVQDGCANYLRVRASELAARLPGNVDIALMRVSPPDNAGWCSVGPSGSIARPLLDSARIVVAEIDPTVPRLHGPGASVHVDELDFVTDTQTQAAWPATAKPDAAMRRAAERVVELIGSGASVQLGIGAQTEAVGAAIADSGRTDIRLVGMGSRAALQMAETGVLTAGPDTVRVAEILGDADVVTAFDEHPALELHSSSTMHQPEWLGRIPGLVSVSTGLQIDERGNVASERVGDRVISGIGGSLDFIEGARRSIGGVSVLVLTSAGKPKAGHTQTRLVPALNGVDITIPGALIDVVVTEYGTADLRDVDDIERAARLRAVFEASS